MSPLVALVQALFRWLIPLIERRRNPGVIAEQLPQGGRERFAALITESARIIQLLLDERTRECDGQGPTGGARPVFAGSVPQIRVEDDNAAGRPHGARGVAEEFFV